MIRFLISWQVCHEAASQRCFSTILPVERILFSLLSSAVCFCLIVFPSNFRGSAEILGAALVTTHFAAEGVVCDGGVKALERDSLARCVYPDTEQNTHTPEREREGSDGLLAEAAAGVSL